MPTVDELRKKLSKKPDTRVSVTPKVSPNVIADLTVLTAKETARKLTKIAGKFSLKHKHKPPPAPPITLQEDKLTSLPEGYVPNQKKAMDYVSKRVETYGDRNQFLTSIWTKSRKFGRLTPNQIEAIGKIMIREPIAKIRPRIILVGRFNEILKYINTEVWETLGENNKKRQYIQELVGVIKNVEEHGGRITEPQFHFVCYRIYKVAPQFLKDIDCSETKGIPKGYPT